MEVLFLTMLPNQQSCVVHCTTDATSCYKTLLLGVNSDDVAILLSTLGSKTFILEDSRRMVR